MSPRTIHFTSNEIIFECREQIVCHGCAQSGLSTKADPATAWYEGKSAFSTLHQDWDEKEQLLRFRVVWDQVVHDYSHAKLTNIDDRLSALAGIAQLAEIKFQYHASYGLWLEFFIDELQWRSGNGNAETCDRIPSWSWVSRAREGVLQHNYEKQITSDRELLSATITSFPPITSFTRLSALYTQSPLSASFKIRGRIKTFRTVPVSDELPMVIS